MAKRRAGKAAVAKLTIKAIGRTRAGLLIEVPLVKSGVPPGLSCQRVTGGLLVQMRGAADEGEQIASLYVRGGLPRMMVENLPPPVVQAGASLPVRMAQPGDPVGDGHPVQVSSIRGDEDGYPGTTSIEEDDAATPMIPGAESDVRDADGNVIAIARDPYIPASSAQPDPPDPADAEVLDRHAEASHRELSVVPDEETA
jgi:hypothetical protein